MKKEPFVTYETLQEIIKEYPTPFHLYDEKGIRENAKAVNEAFAWNKGFREYFAVKANPNPFLIRILKECGCGVDCSSMTELMLSDALGFSGEEIMFSSNDTPAEEFVFADSIQATINLDDFTHIAFWKRRSEKFPRRSAAGLIRAACLKSAIVLWIIPEMQNTGLQKNSYWKAFGS